jgi:hypothetical protein
MRPTLREPLSKAELPTGVDPAKTIPGYVRLGSGSFDAPTSGNCQGNAAAPRRVVNADQEVWVAARIRAAIRMAIALSREAYVGADGPLFRQAVRGLAEGAAVEIIHTLDLEPSYVNLPKVPSEI